QHDLRGTFLEVLGDDLAGAVAPGEFAGRSHLAGDGDDDLVVAGADCACVVGFGVAVNEVGENDFALEEADRRVSDDLGLEELVSHGWLLSVVSTVAWLG